MSVNFKSLVVGLLLGVILLLLLGAVTGQQSTGKYQIALTCDPTGYVIFAQVDTDTGEIVTFKKGNLQIPEKFTVRFPRGYLPEARQSNDR